MSGSDVWQFRWSEAILDSKRLYRKKTVGTVEQYPDVDAARRGVVGLVSEVNAEARPTNSRARARSPVRAEVRGIPFADDLESVERIHIRIQPIPQFKATAKLGEFPKERFSQSL